MLTFRLGSLSVAVEVYRARAIKLISSCVERLSLLNVEAVEIFHADA